MRASFAVSVRTMVNVKPVMDLIASTVAPGTWQFDDASGKVEDRVLSGQQSHGVLSACAVHIPWLYFPAKEGHEQAAPDIYQFPAGCER